MGVTLLVFRLTLSKLKVATRSMGGKDGLETVPLQTISSSGLRIKMIKTKFKLLSLRKALQASQPQKLKAKCLSEWFKTLI